MNCGGHHARYVGGLHDEFDPLWLAHVHTFEPNPVFWPGYDQLGRHTLHKKAVWTSNGVTHFFLQDDPRGQGHSLCVDKTNVNVTNSIEVECIDFAEWLNASFTERDHIIVRMDIEGAEYAVLRHLIETRALARIAMLFVEFHHYKYPKLATHVEYLDITSRINIPFQEIKH